MVGDELGQPAGDDPPARLAHDVADEQKFHENREARGGRHGQKEAVFCFARPEPLAPCPLPLNPGIVLFRKIYKPAFPDDGDLDLSRIGQFILDPPSQLSGHE